jgi:hypothetical protein
VPGPAAARSRTARRENSRCGSRLRRRRAFSGRSRSTSGSRCTPPRARSRGSTGLLDELGLTNPQYRARRPEDRNAREPLPAARSLTQRTTSKRLGTRCAFALPLKQPRGRRPPALAPWTTTSSHGSPVLSGEAGDSRPQRSPLSSLDRTGSRVGVTRIGVIQQRALDDRELLHSGAEGRQS